MNDIGITPDIAPAGARILIKERGAYYKAPVEVTVIEWAPSGQFVKLRYASGTELWDEDLRKCGVLVETLPKAKAINRFATTIAWRVYGPPIIVCATFLAMALIVALFGVLSQ